MGVHIIRKLENLVNSYTEKGWDLTEFKEKTGIDMGYHRTGKGNYKYKFPSNFGFIKLGEIGQYALFGYEIVMGIRRTVDDTKEGRVVEHWHGHVENSFNGYYGAAVPISSPDVTCFMIAYYYPEKGLINIDSIQGTKLDVNSIYDEMLYPEDDGIDHFSIMDEFANKPWRYSDRMLLLGACIRDIAKQLDATSLSVPVSNGEAIYERVYRFLKRHNNNSIHINMQ